MTAHLHVDPGVGSESAPIGSEKWAQRVRYSMQRLTKELATAPEDFIGYYDLCTKHRAWALMNKPDGSFFDTWEEFCSHPEPYGLGRPWESIRAVVEAAKGKKVVQLGTVAPAKAPPALSPGPGRGHKAGKADCVERNELSDTQRAARVRAITRAPEPVRDLYRADLIGQKEAAKLGPKNPTPEQAAKVTAVARTVANVAKAESPATPRARRELQRRVNAVVRKELGEEQGQVPKLVKTIAKLGDTDRMMLFGELVNGYPNLLKWAR